MTHPAISRRAFAIGTGVLGAALTAGEAAAEPPRRPIGARLAEVGITGGHEAIHQEIEFKASPGEVYRALTEAALFDKVVAASGALEKKALGHAASRIAPGVGGAFSLFGGMIVGRHLELTPGVRLVQAWRSNGWAAHLYSIARFELAAAGGGTHLVFDHTGFPDGEAASLATGWHENYWTPLAQVLG